MCGRTVPGGLPLSHNGRDIGMVSGQTGPVGVPSEQEVGFCAETPDRSPAEGDRFARDSADLGVVDPLVGQLTGQPRTLELVGVERDIP
jgi:hypothetical protein